MGIGDNKPSVFAVYIEKAAPAPAPVPEGTSPEARRLINWLQNNWRQQTICARDIQIFGPHPHRDKASVTKLTEALEKRGWLLPLRSHRCDRKRWQVTVGPA